MKKLLSVFLVAGMLLAMVACGGAPASSGTASGSAAASGSGGSAEPSGKLVIYSPNADTQVASKMCIRDSPWAGRPHERAGAGPFPL